MLGAKAFFEATQRLWIGGRAVVGRGNPFSVLDKYTGKVMVDFVTSACLRGLLLQVECTIKGGSEEDVREGQDVVLLIYAVGFFFKVDIRVSLGCTEQGSYEGEQL